MTPNKHIMIYILENTRMLTEPRVDMQNLLFSILRHEC